MKKLILLCLLLPDFIFASVGHSELYIRPSEGSEQNVYWGAHLANMKVKKVKNRGNFTDDFDFTDKTVSIAFGSGYNFGFMIGYQSGAWRYESDLTWWEGNHGEIKIDEVLSSDVPGRAGESGKGKTNVLSLLFDVYYDVLDQNNFAITPVVGAGFGFAMINTMIGQSIATTSSNTKTAYDYSIGAALKASDDLTLQVLFRNFITKSAPSALIGKPFKANGLEFGLRYSF